MHTRDGRSGIEPDIRRSWATGLALALALCVGPVSWAAPLQATPVVDPAADPGDDIPPVGRSLFDHLVSRDMPGDFASLRQRIEAQVQRRADATVPGLKQVLIPLGRSLQRSAAAPRFFESPRIVLAVDEEPATSTGYAGPMLKDRLYLGHQARADVLEVISYNEAAGRFEFQVVKDFRPGGRPRVFYANRRLCLACHQNAAPIFSRPTWDETNANPNVAALLNEHAPVFQGVPVDRGIDLPQAIDDASGRANGLAAVQLLWRQGCGENDAAARECRAALFVAALQYRLSGNRQFERRSTAALARLARVRWPGGLALPNPDIPNRDPLTGSRGEVTAPFDPLLLRPALATWSTDDGATLTERAVAGLAGFIAEADAARIDGQLAALARRKPPAQTSWSSPCTVTTSAATPRRERLSFGCSDGSVPGLALAGDAQLDAGVVSGARLRQLRIDDQGELRELPLGAGRATAAGRERVLSLPVRARAADGRAITHVAWRWNGDKGSAQLTLIDDFAPVHRAVQALLDAARQGRFDGFDALPFRRARLMSALEEDLGLPPLRWCCLDTAGLPPAQAEPAAIHIPTAQRGASLPPAASAFFAHCAACHATPNRTPPNFLWGDSAQVGHQLSQCAERLYVRLAMWQLPPAQRPKTPMPPAAALLGVHLAEAAWRDSADLARLVDFARDTLAGDSGHAPDLDRLLARGYDTLRPCLPDADTAAR